MDDFSILEEEEVEVETRNTCADAIVPDTSRSGPVRRRVTAISTDREALDIMDLTLFDFPLLQDSNSMQWREILPRHEDVTPFTPGYGSSGEARVFDMTSSTLRTESAEKPLETTSTNTRDGSTTLDLDMNTLSVEERQKLEDFRCPICLETFIEPMKINCSHGHYFCSYCIKRWTVGHLVCNCPVCRGDVSSFDSTGLVSLADLSSEITEFYRTLPEEFQLARALALVERIESEKLLVDQENQQARSRLDDQDGAFNSRGAGEGDFNLYSYQYQTTVGDLYRLWRNLPGNGGRDAMFEHNYRPPFRHDEPFASSLEETIEANPYTVGISGDVGQGANVAADNSIDGRIGSHESDWQWYSRRSQRHRSTDNVGGDSSSQDTMTYDNLSRGSLYSRVPPGFGLEPYLHQFGTAAEGMENVPYGISSVSDSTFASHEFPAVPSNRNEMLSGSRQIHHPCPSFVNATSNASDNFRIPVLPASSRTTLRLPMASNISVSTWTPVPLRNRTVNVSALINCHTLSSRPCNGNRPATSNNGTRAIHHYANALAANLIDSHCGMRSESFTPEVNSRTDTANTTQHDTSMHDFRQNDNLATNLYGNIGMNHPSAFRSSVGVAGCPTSSNYALMNPQLVPQSGSFTMTVPVATSNSASGIVPPDYQYQFRNNVSVPPQQNFPCYSNDAGGRGSTTYFHHQNGAAPAQSPVGNFRFQQPNYQCQDTQNHPGHFTVPQTPIFNEQTMQMPPNYYYGPYVPFNSSFNTNLVGPRFNFPCTQMGQPVQHQGPVCMPPSGFHRDQRLYSSHPSQFGHFYPRQNRESNPILRPHTSPENVSQSGAGNPWLQYENYNFNNVSNQTGFCDNNRIMQEPSQPQPQQSAPTMQARSENLQSSVAWSRVSPNCISTSAEAATLQRSINRNRSWM